MNGGKILLLMIVFIIVGLIFIGTGILFLSEKYLDGIARVAGTSENSRNHAVKSVRVCGYIAIGIGAFTVVCGLTVKLFPAVFQYMALMYVIALIAAFAVIINAIKIR